MWKSSTTLGSPPSNKCSGAVGMLEWWHSTSSTRCAPLGKEGAHGDSEHVILQAPYSQQCSPSTCPEVMPLQQVVMKCLRGGVRGLLGPPHIISAFKWGQQIHSSSCLSTPQGSKMELHLTLSLYKNPEQWMSTWNSLEEVVIIINREKVSMHISISDHHFQVGYVMNVKN